MYFADKNDEQLITDYIHLENEEIFQTLLNRHIKQVYNFIRHMVHSENEAEDITQEVFIKVWKNIKKYKLGQNFKTWLFSIAKNSTIDFLRKRKVLNFSDLDPVARERRGGGENSIDFSETIPDESLLPDEALEKLQNVDFLNKLLETLSFEYKTILLLHYQEEMTFEEIGKILKKPLNTVKSYHRRAILELRKKI